MKQIICFFFGHRWEVFGVRKDIKLAYLFVYICSRCGKIKRPKTL
ncbi:MAG: hypothetical protein WC196_02760 [Bacilli bacterium]